MVRSQATATISDLAIAERVAVTAKVRTHRLCVCVCVCTKAQLFYFLSLSLSLSTLVVGKHLA